jgi:hypothetical protein
MKILNLFSISDKHLQSIETKNDIQKITKLLEALQQVPI